jgi:hypothetical protein
MARPLSDEARRLALGSSLTLQARRLAPQPLDGLEAAAEALAAATHRGVAFDPAYPGLGEREGRRLLLACRAYRDGEELGTVFTALIVGREPTVSVAPPGTPLH